MMIRVNMAVSLDGKIAPAERGKLRLGGRADLRRMESLRAWADVIVVGAGTIRAEDPPFTLGDEELRRQRLDEGRSEHPLVIVISTEIDLGPVRVFNGPGRAILATTDRAAEGNPDLPSGVEVWRLGSERVELDRLLERIASEGFERLLVEGGGGIASLFFEQDRVDEIWLTQTPWLIGGDDAPGIADADRLFDPFPRYHLVAVETVAGDPEETFLIYRKGTQLESDR